MGNHWHLEHSIRVNKQELAKTVLEDSGWIGADKDDFVLVLEAMSSLLVLDSFRHLDQLKTAYAPFDPDTDYMQVNEAQNFSPDECLDKIEKGIVQLLEKANFERVTWEMVDEWVQKSGDFWGVRLEVPHDEFERVVMYSRGEKFINRKVRRWWRPWLKDVVPTAGFSRVAVFVNKKGKHEKTGESSNPKVFLRLFKDIPKTEIPMVFPGAKVRLTTLDQSLIGYPLLSGGFLVAYNLIATILKVGFTALLGLTTWPLAFAFGGYGYKTYYNYVTKRQDFDLRMTKNLYYQSLDSNAGVVMRLLDEAEEQDSCECILGYYCLLKYAPHGGWSEKQTDDFVEIFFKRHFGLDLDFDFQDCLSKLKRFGVVVENGGLLTALKPAEALKELQTHWQQGLFCRQMVEPF